MLVYNLLDGSLPTRLGVNLPHVARYKQVLRQECAIIVPSLSDPSTNL